MLKLYNYYRSSASFRVRIALNLKNLEYDVIPVNLLKEEQLSEKYANINPQQLVPTLQIGHQFLSQSLAIIEYLEDVYPKPSLLPGNAYEKAVMRSFALLIASDLHPLNNLSVLKYLTRELRISEEQKQEWYQHWIKKRLSALEKQLKKTASLGHPFCFSNQPSLADICLVPQLYNARRFNCALDDYPQLLRVESNCQNLQAFEKAFPEEVVPG